MDTYYRNLRTFSSFTFGILQLLDTESVPLKFNENPEQYLMDLSLGSTESCRYSSWSKLGRRVMKKVICWAEPKEALSTVIQSSCLTIEKFWNNQKQTLKSWSLNRFLKGTGRREERQTAKEEGREKAHLCKRASHQIQDLVVNLSLQQFRWREKTQNRQVLRKERMAAGKLSYITRSVSNHCRKTRSSCQMDKLMNWWTDELNQIPLMSQSNHNVRIQTIFVTQLLTKLYIPMSMS